MFVELRTQTHTNGHGRCQAQVRPSFKLKNKLKKLINLHRHMLMHVLISSSNQHLKTHIQHRYTCPYTTQAFFNITHPIPFGAVGMWRKTGGDNCPQYKFYLLIIFPTPIFHHFLLVQQTPPAHLDEEKKTYGISIDEK